MSGPLGRRPVPLSDPLAAFAAEGAGLKRSASSATEVSEEQAVSSLFLLIQQRLGRNPAKNDVQEIYTPGPGGWQCTLNVRFPGQGLVAGQALRHTKQIAKKAAAQNLLRQLGGPVPIPPTPAKRQAVGPQPSFGGADVAAAMHHLRHAASTSSHGDRRPTGKSMLETPFAMSLKGFKGKGQGKGGAFDHVDHTHYNHPKSPALMPTSAVQPAAQGHALQNHFDILEAMSRGL